MRSRPGYHAEANTQWEDGERRGEAAACAGNKRRISRSLTKVAWGGAATEKRPG